MFYGSMLRYFFPRSQFTKFPFGYRMGTISFPSLGANCPLTAAVFVRFLTALRAEGKPRRDPAKVRSYERKRTRRDAANRTAQDLCTRCGQAPAAPDRVSCEPCLAKRDYASYYTSIIPVGHWLADRLSSGKPSPWLFGRRRVRNLAQVVGLVVVCVSTEKPGLAPLSDCGD